VRRQTRPLHTARRTVLIAAALPCTLIALLNASGASAARGRHAKPAARGLHAGTRCAAARARRAARPTRPARRSRTRWSCSRRLARRTRHRTPPALEATPLLPAAGTPQAGAEDAAGASPAPARPRGNPAPRRPPLPLESGEVVNDPIDPRFLTYFQFGARSFWLQPWRAYLDTWPASRLQDALGINFNVNLSQAEATAQLLQDSGFKLARVPINWSDLSYSNPTGFSPSKDAAITARLGALHNHGLRPLIVLEAYSGAPTPLKHVTLETTSPAPAGATSVQLSGASAAQVVPRKSGFNGLSFGGSPDILISSVSAAGVATLSRPLPNALAAGPHGGTVLLYAPFAAPRLANGEPNPEFQETLAGWLSYVDTVCRKAASVVGPGGFDLEIWNELSFGSQFLNSEHYYSTSGESGSATAARPFAGAASEAPPATSSEGDGEGTSSEAPPPAAEYGSEAGQEAEEGPESGEPGEVEAEVEGSSRAAAIPHKRVVNKEVRKALLEATVAYVRDPAHGFSPDVGITNGFASQTPFPSGALAPIGLTALSKHPYVSALDYPADYPSDHAIPLNAQGLRDTTRASFAPLFTPGFQALFPEYTLSGNFTETLIRDVAPFTNYVYKFPHGRNVGPAGGSPVQKWITEYNLGVGKATVMGPDGSTPASGAAATVGAADRAHFEAKVVLRSLVAMVSKGISREYFYAAAPGALSLIDGAFFAALEAHPGSYPGDQLGGETMDGLRNLLSHLQGPGPAAGGGARQLTLLSIAQDGNHAQFSGDGTTAHPDLYDRDLLAVFPFQSSPTQFVIPVYVMTQDLLTLYRREASPGDITRFDLPEESFRITLGNLPETTSPPTVSAYDPLRDRATSARLVAREGSTAVFEIEAGDYPRLLSLDYGGG
jgi:hypothetical protein